MAWQEIEAPKQRTSFQLHCPSPHRKNESIIKQIHTFTSNILFEQRRFSLGCPSLYIIYIHSQMARREWKPTNIIATFLCFQKVAIILVGFRSLLAIWLDKGWGNPDRKVVAQTTCCWPWWTCGFDFPARTITEKWIQLIPKTIGNRKRDCVWGCSRGINTTWEKSADRNAQIRKAFVPLTGLICAFRYADFLRLGLSPEHNLTHNLFFYFQ